MTDEDRVRDMLEVFGIVQTEMLCRHPSWLKLGDLVRDFRKLAFKKSGAVDRKMADHLLSKMESIFQEDP